MYMDVKIELNDELTLFIKSVFYYPGRKGKYNGPADNCYESEPPEVEWEDDKVFLIYEKDKKELAFNIDTHFADLYIEEIFEYCEDELRERRNDYD